MRSQTVSERTADTAVPPKKPPAPSVERGPRQAAPGIAGELDGPPVP